MTEEKAKNPRIATLKNIRLSFTNSLEEAKATVADGVPKHGCNIILEKDKPEYEANKAAVIAALEAVGEEKWQNKDKYKVIASKKPDRVQFRKGELYTNGDGDIYKGYEGNMVVTVYGPGGSKKPQRPKIMDRRKNWIWNPEKGAKNVSEILDVCYSGTYADAKVEFYPSDQGGDGIFTACHLIRSRQTGDRMAGGYSVTDSDADDFEDLEDDLDDDATTGTGGSNDDDDLFG